MSKTRDTGYLNNIIKYTESGDITFVNGDTTLLSISSSGAITTTGVISGSSAESAISASYAQVATSASQAQNAVSSSFAANAANATSASFALNAANAVSASQAQNAISSSFATNASSSNLLDGKDSTEFAITGSNIFTGTQYTTNAINPNGFGASASVYTDGGLRVTKDAYVSGTMYVNNLTVFGTQSINYITSSQLNISTNIISVNTDTPSIRFGGLSVYDSGSTGLTGSMLWDSERDHWVYSNPSGSSYNSGMLISGPRNSGSLGTEQGTINNVIVKGQGGDHVTSSQIIDDGTTVRIPGALQVTGSIVGSSTATFASSVTASSFIANPSGNGFITVGASNSYGSISSGGGSATLYLNGATRGGSFTAASNAVVLATDGNYFISNANADSFKMFVSSSGLVGIGTTSPAYTLDVVSSTSGNLGRFYYTDGTYNPRLQITGDSTGITFYESYSTGADSIKFSIAGSSTLTLKGNDVGIGTTTPSYRFHVSGAFSSNPGMYLYGTTYAMIGVDRGSSASSAGTSYYTTGSQRWFTGIYENTNNFGFYNAGSVNFPLVIQYSNGAVGMGTTTPSYPLHVANPGIYHITAEQTSVDTSNANAYATFYVINNAGSSQVKGLFGAGGNNVGNTAMRNAVYYGAQTNHSVVFVTNDAERMRITTGGDVSMTGTGAMKIQSGTTAQRPTAATGQIRYNTSFNFLEYYDGSNWIPVTGQTSPGSSASNPAESANEIKTYNPNATNGLYWIRQIGTVPLQAYCVFTDYTGAAIQGGPWTVPIISNDPNNVFSDDGPTAAAQFLSKCQAIGIASPGRGMENTRTTTEVYGAWLAIKRALWNNYSSFITNGTTGGGAVLRMPMVNINGAGGTSDQRLVYNTSLGTHLPPNIDGDACNANQLFCGWWAGTDVSGWRVNDNAIPGPEDWNPSDTVNGSYSGNGLQSALTICVYK